MNCHCIARFPAALPIAAVVLGALLAAAPLVSSAATLVQTASIGASSAGIPAQHNLVSAQSLWTYDQFDPALGILTAVAFSAHIVATGNSTEINPFSFTYTWSPYLDFKSSGSLGSGGTFRQFPFVNDHASGSNVVIVPLSSGTYSHTFTRDLSTSLSAPADLAGFTGLDHGHFWLDTGMGSSNDYGGVNVSATAAVSLTYTYSVLPSFTPGPGPAPASAPDHGWTLILFTPLMAGLVALSRRRPSVRQFGA